MKDYSNNSYVFTPINKSLQVVKDKIKLQRRESGI